MQKSLLKKKYEKKCLKKLSGALAEYTDKLNKKKFESKLKKASKPLAAGIVKAITKTIKPGVKRTSKNNYTDLLIYKSIV